MKKLLPVLLFLASCRSDEGAYIAHVENQYTVADDTLIIHGMNVINRTGYQKIRHGKVLPKQHKIRQWGLHSPNAPALIIRDDQLTLGQTIYQRIK